MTWLLIHTLSHDARSAVLLWNEVSNQINGYIPMAKSNAHQRGEKQKTL